MSLSARSLRRTLACLLLVLVTGHVLAGLVVAGQEERSDPSAAVPEGFVTAAPAIGDVLEYRTYVAQADGSWQEDTDARILLELMDDQVILDRDGAPRHVHQVRVDVASSLDVPWLVPMIQETPLGHGHETAEFLHRLTRDGFYLLFDASDQSVVGFVINREDFHRTEEVVGRSGSESQYLRTTLVRPGHLVPCGLYHALQGQGTMIGPLFQACIGPSGAPLGEGDVFEPVGTQQAGRYDTVVYGLQPGGEGLSASVWLSEEIPYPLRIETSVPGSEETHAVVLTGFTRGDLPSSRAPMHADHAPRLEYAPTQPWGIDDSETDHPFPLSAAYKKALTDPLYHELREFVAQHPDAFTAHASYSKSIQGGDVLRKWDVAVVDGSSHIGFCASQRVLTESVETLQGVPRMDAGNLATYQVKSCTGTWNIPETRPDMMPTADSLLARAKAYVDFDGDGEFYGFSISSGLSNDPMPHYWAGASQIGEHAEKDGGNVLTKGTYQLATYIEVDQEGSTTAYVHRDSRQVRNFDPVAQETGQTAAASSAPAVPQATGLLAWSPWGIETVIGISLAALLVSALYGLGSFLKSSLFGFTRIERPKALAHPHRSRIMALLEDEPGLHIQEITRRLGLSRSVAKHHLQKLEVVGLATSVKGRGFTCYFPKGATDRRWMEAAPVLKAPGAMAVLDVIQTRPGCSQAMLAEATALDPSTVHHHTRRLVEAGFVQRRREGRMVRHYTTPAAIRHGEG